MVLTASFVLSPVIGLSCHRPRRDAKHHRQVDASVEASGPHDLAVRLTRVRLCAPKASTASPPNVRDDRETPLLIGHGMAGILPVIWEGDQSRDLRRIGTTGRSGVRAEIVSSEEQLLGHHPTPVSSPPCAQLRTGAGTHTPRLCLRQAAGRLSTHYNDRWLWVPAFAGTTANEATGTSIALDTPAPRFVNPGSGPLPMTAGRIAQRESVPFTRERSKVRSLVRPPELSIKSDTF